MKLSVYSVYSPSEESRDPSSTTSRLIPTAIGFLYRFFKSRSFGPQFGNDFSLARSMLICTNIAFRPIVLSMKPSIAISSDYMREKGLWREIVGYYPRICGY